MENDVGKTTRDSVTSATITPHISCPETITSPNGSSPREETIRRLNVATSPAAGSSAVPKNDEIGKRASYPTIRRSSLLRHSEGISQTSQEILEGSSGSRDNHLQRREDAENHVDHEVDVEAQERTRLEEEEKERVSWKRRCALIGVICLHFIAGCGAITSANLNMFDIKVEKGEGKEPEKFTSTLLWTTLSIGSDSLAMIVFMAGLAIGMFPDFRTCKTNPVNAEDEDAETIVVVEKPDMENPQFTSRRESAMSLLRHPMLLTEDDDRADSSIQEQEKISVSRASHTNREIAMQEGMNPDRNALPININEDALPLKTNEDGVPPENIHRGWHPALFFFTVTGCFNLCATYSNFQAIYHLNSAANYQMFRGGRLVFVGLLSRFVFRTRMFGKSHWMGISMALTGILTVGLTLSLLKGVKIFKSASSIGGPLLVSTEPTMIPGNSATEPTIISATEPTIMPGKSSTTTLQTQFIGVRPDHSAMPGTPSSVDENRSLAMGVLLATAGALLGSLQVCTQEKIYEIIPNTSPLLVVGIEGLTGLGLLAGIVPIMTAISNKQYIDFHEGVYQLGTSGILKVVFAIYMTCNVAAACCGTFIGKSLSGAGRSLLEYCRVLVLWGIELIVYTVIYGWARGKAEKLAVNEWVFWGEKLGFILIIVGTLIFFQFIRFACWEGVNDDCHCCGSRPIEDDIIEEDDECDTKNEFNDHYNIGDGIRTPMRNARSSIHRTSSSLRTPQIPASGERIARTSVISVRKSDRKRGSSISQPIDRTAIEMVPTYDDDEDVDTKV